jgi:hypothetical protein
VVDLLGQGQNTANPVDSSVLRETARTVARMVSANAPKAETTA